MHIIKLRELRKKAEEYLRVISHKEYKSDDKKPLSACDKALDYDRIKITLKFES